MKCALILDLDNTIYPVSSIADHLFKQLFDLIDQYSDNMDYDTVQRAKDELKKRPFQFVADDCNFSPELKKKGIELLRDISYDLPMKPHNGYEQVKSIPLTKFLVTTGFSKLQWSKIKMLGIEKDFEEIHIVDPEVSGKTKKDIFQDIMQRHNYKPEDLLVVGDDPGSEIKAARELGIETYLFDHDNDHPYALVTFRNRHLKNVCDHI
jgi:putative hydrolase of the HAD superfamily